MAAGDQCMAAEKQTWAKHAQFPDGTFIDARDLAGYNPPVIGMAEWESSATGRDAQGKTVSDYERQGGR